jgi:hypothetical protein
LRPLKKLQQVSFLRLQDRNVTTEESGTDSETSGKRPYRSPKLVQFGSIKSLPDVGAEDWPALADPRLQFIVECWKAIPEGIKDELYDRGCKVVD